jgi:hypothetical protein
MKRFRMYVMEKMNENGPTTMPVAQYFPKTPSTHFQDDIPIILGALLAHKLHPIQKTLNIRALVPTQLLINMSKVFKKAGKPDNPNHPLVVLHNDGDYYLIDGHHRACALLMHHVTKIPMTVIESEDVARILHW